MNARPLALGIVFCLMAMPKQMSCSGHCILFKSPQYLECCGADSTRRSTATSCSAVWALPHGFRGMGLRARHHLHCEGVIILRGGHSEDDSDVASPRSRRSEDSADTKRPGKRRRAADTHGRAVQDFPGASGREEAVKDEQKRLEASFIAAVVDGNVVALSALAARGACVNKPAANSSTAESALHLAGRCLHSYIRIMPHFPP